jgi:hypothetical protein
MDPSATTWEGGKRKQKMVALPLTSSPPRYLSHPFSRILLPKMVRKRSNSLLPRSVIKKFRLAEFIQRLQRDTQPTKRSEKGQNECIRTVAEHFIIGDLAGFGVQNAEFEVDRTFLLFQQQQTLRQLNFLNQLKSKSRLNFN